MVVGCDDGTCVGDGYWSNDCGNGCGDGGSDCGSSGISDGSTGNTLLLIVIVEAVLVKEFEGGVREEGVIVS